MGIDKNQFGDIWRSVKKWKKRRNMSSLTLAGLVGCSQNYIEKGISNGTEWITSDFIHNLVDAFLLTSARQRGVEDMSDILTDEECIDAITAILDEEN